MIRSTAKDISNTGSPTMFTMTLHFCWRWTMKWIITWFIRKVRTKEDNWLKRKDMRNSLRRKGLECLARRESDPYGYCRVVSARVYKDYKVIYYRNRSFLLALMTHVHSRARCVAHGRYVQEGNEMRVENRSHWPETRGSCHCRTPDKYAVSV